MANVVLNSLGSEAWPIALEVLGSGGRLVFFGTLTGAKVSLELAMIYGREARIIGTTGGSRKEMQELIEYASKLKVRVWKKLRLEETASALKLLSSKERDGRIMIEF
jgi:D-arabinose 1-dehydrogenase-like Zn-dependent alcohol dehydrogenase